MKPLRRDSEGNVGLLLALAVIGIAAVVLFAVLAGSFGGLVGGGCGIQGRVLDATTNAEIAGASLFISRGADVGGETYRVSSRSDGSYSVGVSCGRGYAIQGSASGYTSPGPTYTGDLPSGTWVTRDVSLMPTPG